MPALDGIRALAIAAVLLYHGGVALLPGGFLGVDMFFVLSGYLVTSLLLNEYGRRGSISLSGFYWNRVRRLIPAFVTMLFLVATFASLFMPDSVASTWRDLPWALNGLSNWWLVLHQQSYFEAIGRPLLLQHTWSLAVEAQFYAFWPFALLLVLPRLGKRGVAIVAGLLALASAAASLLLGAHLDAVSKDAVSHLYFGTDTRSMGLFLGAALATVWQPAGRSSPLASISAHWAVNLAGVLPLAGLLLLLRTIDETAGPQWVYGFSLCAVLSTLLIVAATFPGSVLGGVLAIRPLRWVGERSYGMYLWHWPIFQATRPGIDSPLTGTANLLLRLALTAAVAEISYRFVEMPVRRGAAERLWSKIRAWSPRTIRLAAVAAVAILTPVVATEAVLANRAVSSYQASLQAYVIPAPPKPHPPHVVHRSRVAGVDRDYEAHMIRHAALASPALLVGDSVMLGASQWIGQSLNVVRTDAVVGRQAITTLEVVEQKAEAGKLEPTMVINLGNNGTVEEPTLRSLLRLLRRCDQVVIVNARVPRPWQDDNDMLMRRVVPQYRNAVLADWYTASAGHPEYFGEDGVHMNAVGAKAYTAVIVAALETAALQRARARALHAQAVAAKRAARAAAAAARLRMATPSPEET